MRAGCCSPAKAAGRPGRPGRTVSLLLPLASRHHHCVLLPNELVLDLDPISPSPLPSQLQRNNSSVSRTNRLDLSIVFPVRKRPSAGKSTRDSFALAHDSRHSCSLYTRIAGSQLWIQPRRFARACEWTHNCTIPPPFFLPSGTASMMIH